MMDGVVMETGAAPTSERRFGKDGDLMATSCWWKIPAWVLSPILTHCLTAIKKSCSSASRPGKTSASRSKEVTSGPRGFCARSPPPSRTKSQELSKGSRGREGPLRLPPGSSFCMALRSIRSARSPASSAYSGCRFYLRVKAGRKEGAAWGHGEGWEKQQDALGG